MGSLFNFNPIIQSENHATNKGKTAMGAKKTPTRTEEG